MPFPALEVIPATTPPKVREQMLDARSEEFARSREGQVFARELYVVLQRSIVVPTVVQGVQWLMDSAHLLIEYAPDPAGQEIFQSVPYTIGCGLALTISPLTGRKKGRGDCEDLSAAVVGTGRAWRYLGLMPHLEMRNRWWDQPGASQNHVAGVACDPQFPNEPCVSVETTVPGALLGDDPQTALLRVGGEFRSRVFGPEQITYLR